MPAAILRKYFALSLDGEAVIISILQMWKWNVGAAGGGG